MAKKKNGGRPTLWKDRFVQEAGRMASIGLPDKDIALLLGVSDDTLTRFRKSHKRFADAIERGRAGGKKSITKAMFDRACGYSHKAVKIFMTRDGATVEHEYMEHWPPDVQAGFQWLCNRDRENWQNSHHIEAAGLTVNFAAVVKAIRNGANGGKDKDG